MVRSAAERSAVYSVLGWWLALLLLDMLVEELVAADPPLPEAVTDRLGARPCVRCKRPQMRPSTNELRSGTTSAWASLAADAGEPDCGHWLCWECFEEHAAHFDPYQAVESKLVRCPECSAVVGDVFRAIAPGRKGVAWVDMAVLRAARLASEAEEEGSVTGRAAPSLREMKAALAPFFVGDEPTPAANREAHSPPPTNRGRVSSAPKKASM